MCAADDREQQGRARGCLLGAACGDGLGAPFEGSATVDAEQLSTWLRTPIPLTYTDDTAMMIVLAEHLAGAVAIGGDLDQDALAEAFLRAWQAEPRRGYGAGTVRLFEQMMGGTSWREARLSLFAGQGSFGNGAAMRVAPVGLLPYPLTAIAALARRTADVTHAHPLGREGAVAQACAVALALTGDRKEALDRAAFLDQLGHQVDEAAYHEQLVRLAQLTPHTPAEQIATEIGNGVSALEAVPAALAAFLLHPDDPWDAVDYAISIGGDTDTIATMTGALVGARRGETALPATWLSRLPGVKRLSNLADTLTGAPPQGTAGAADH